MPPTSALSPGQRAALQDAVTAAERGSAIRFAVHLGPLEHGRQTALGLLARVQQPAITVLVAVDTGARQIEIVTGPEAARSISDRTCGLAALTMSSSFAGGDLVGGLRSGLQLLAEHARTGAPRTTPTVY